MNIFSVFSKKAMKDPLKPLSDIISSLEGKSEVNDLLIYNCYLLKNRQGSGYINQDPEDEISINRNFSQVIPVKSEQSYSVVSVSKKIKWTNLLGKLKDLHRHLDENKSNYSSGYVAQIAKKSHEMIVKINAYLEEYEEYEEYEEKNQRKKAEAITAINDFHNAFKLSQTRNIILMGLVLAIIGSLLILFAGHFGIPLALAGFKTQAIGGVISGGGGVGILSARLRNAFFGITADTKKYADESKQAAEKLLLSMAISTKDKKRDETYTPEDKDREGICAWLARLFNSSNDKYHSFASRTKITHDECVGGKSRRLSFTENSS